MLFYLILVVLSFVGQVFGKEEQSAKTKESTSKQKNVVANKPPQPKDNQELVLPEFDDNTIYKDKIKEAADKYGFRGDWVAKKVLLIKAAGILREIIDTNREIVEARNNIYNPKIEAISNSMKSFRLISGGNKEDIVSAILNLQDKTDSKLNEILELSKEADLKNFSPSLRYKLYDAEEKYSSFKEKLAKLKMDVDFVEDLQKAFDNRVTQLDKGVAQGESLANQADKLVDEISYTLDHNKAEEKAFMVENILKNVRLVKNYVTVDALKLFDSEQAALAKEVDRLKGEITNINNELSKTDKEVLSLQKDITTSFDASEKVSQTEVPPKDDKKSISSPSQEPVPKQNGTKAEPVQASESKSFLKKIVDFFWGILKFFGW